TGVRNRPCRRRRKDPRTGLPQPLPRPDAGRRPDAGAEPGGRLEPDAGNEPAAAAGHPAQPGTRERTPAGSRRRPQGSRGPPSAGRTGRRPGQPGGGPHDRADHPQSPAAAGRTDFQIGARRLRERQGGFRHAARRPAPDPQRPPRAAARPGQPADAAGRHRTPARRRPVKTGPTLIVVALALAAGGFAGYQFARPKGGAAPQATAETSAAQPARKLLYYRNPMGLPDTSPTPKKDPMGMDYIAVYEGEAEPAAEEGQVKISADRIQKLGVRSEPVERREIDRVLRAVGKVEIDERRMHTV